VVPCWSVSSTYSGGKGPRLRNLHEKEEQRLTVLRKWEEHHVYLRKWKQRLRKARGIERKRKGIEREKGLQSILEGGIKVTRRAIA